MPRHRHDSMNLFSVACGVDNRFGGIHFGFAEIFVGITDPRDLSRIGIERIIDSGLVRLSDPNQHIPVAEVAGNDPGIARANLLFERSEERRAVKEWVRTCSSG